MLGTIKKNKKTTFLSGIGVALFLCLLMVLMPMSNYVQNGEEEVSLVDAAPSENENDFFKLPGEVEEIEYEYDADAELKGFRDAYTKAYLNDDGEIVQLVSNEPVHYTDSYGVWHDIDTNIKATANGYEVTENTFFTAFAPEAGGGVIVQPNEFVDPIVTGIAPMVITLDESGVAPTPFFTGESTNSVQVSGNTIRYSLGHGFDLDYQVEQTQVKQVLVIREKPDLMPGQEWFGLAEGMRLPAGYALFSGDVEIGSEVYQTQDALQVRNIETGELFVEIPVPTIIEQHSTDSYVATYFVQVHGNHVVLQTMVEASWLLSDDRVFPLGIDPTIQVTSSAGGYCYIYYTYCYSSSYRYHYRYYSYYYYAPWHKYTFSSSNALPSGATVSKIEWKKYMSYAYGSSVTFSVSVLEGCGVDARYNYAITVRACNGNPISASYLTANYGGTASRSLVSAIGNSPQAGTVSSSGTGWKTVSFCSSATACAATSGGISHITSAQNNTGTVGIGERYNSSAYVYTYAYTSGSSNSYIAITYTGGTDSDAPTASFPKYDGQESYIEGERTFFITLTDMSGIDTTSSNGVKLFHRKNNASSWTTTSATTIGTCSSSTNTCKFKATTADASDGDYIEYYWKFQDLNSGSSGNPNVGYVPALTTGQTTPTPYDYWIIDPADAPSGANKFTVLTTDVHAGSYYSPQGFLDRQMTYYEGNDEYYFEFDVSNCGTGSSSCWYTGSSGSNYFYNNWWVRWNTAPYSTSSSYSYGTGGSWGTTGARGDVALHSHQGGYLPGLNAANGPGMNIMMVYDSTDNDWAMIGIGTSPDIENKLSGGSSATFSYSYGYSAGYRIMIPGDITGNFASWEFNASGGSGQANQLCVGTNGFVYFVRYTGSSSGSRCTPAYYYIYNNPSSSSTYRWSGFAMASGYYGRMASTGDITYKVSSIKPLPDTTAPDMDHTPMADSHAKDRRVSVTIADGGDPPSGINTNTTIGEGPTLYYRITDSSGAGSWTSTLLDPPSGKSRAECATAACTWTADIEDLEVNDEVEYRFTSVDNSTASTGVNYNNSSTYSFSRGDPNKMFIVEWRDIGYYTYDQCTVQAVFYDVTNEIEYKYDSGCRATYNSWSIGYMNQARNKGASISTSSSTSYSNPGHIPTTSNYRIHTNSTSHGWEEFDKGLTEIVNYDTALQGSSNGFPYSYYCFYYWSSYSSYCNKNFDMPDGFEFEYFGTSYDGNNSNHRVNVARQGHMWFATSGTSALRSQWTWHYPSWPYSGSTYARPGLISPWSSIYSSYYCFQTSSLDCGVYYRVMPYEGKGTDIYANSITADPQWDTTDSPIRLHPSTDYVTITSDLTVNEGVVIQVANGKGISIDGQCSQADFAGTASERITIEGIAGAEWKGLAFTDDCSSTDDRHTFSYVDIKNTSSAAISAGSRHKDHTVTCIDSSTGGSRSCYTNNNAGNFTMTNVTFTNVETAINHGSGAGTGFYVSDFTVDGAEDACFNFPEDSDVMLYEGTLKNCNTDGNTWGGAIVNYPGSTAGSLWVENVTVTDSYVNFISTDLQDVHLSNITVSNANAQSGVAIDAEHGTNADTYIYNVDVDSYANSGLYAMSSLHIEDVDFGSADVWIVPGYWSQTANGPSGTNMVLDGVEAGDITLRRVHPGTFKDVTADDIDWAGNDITGIPVKMSGLDIEEFAIQGGGWTLLFDDVTAASIKSSGSSGSRNTVVVDGGTFSHSSSSQSVFDGRYTDYSVGEVSVSSTTVSTSGPYLVEARTGTEFVLVESSLNNNDCADADGKTGSCPVSVSGSSSNPSQLYYGGLAWIRAFKLVGSSEQDKSGHTVSASLVDGSGNEMAVNLHSQVTDTNNGSAQVWVIVQDESGTDYTKHNLRAAGPAGVNETLTSDAWYTSTTGDGEFGIGDSVALRLYPAPVTFDDPAINCLNMSQNTLLSSNYDANTNTFRFQETTISVLDSFEIDGCTIQIEGGVLRVTSSSTTSPVITISQGGSLVLTDSPDITGLDGTIVRGSSAASTVRFDMQGGTIDLKNGSQMKNLYQDGTTDSALLIGDGSTFKMSNSALVLGDQASSDDMATVKIDGGTINIDSSTIQNDGQTGTGLWVEAAGGTINGITVKNAAVGIQSYDGAPQVEGFTLTDNTVGIGVYGGMSLPTIYRSTLLSGENAGWKTYAIDASTFLGGGNKFLQIGSNNIYGGGDAHPYYSYSTSHWYLIWDRMNIQLTDTNGNKWNVTSGDQIGYYPYDTDDPAISNGWVDDYDGGKGGAPSWHCNYYGYNYGPNYNYYDGYYYYFYRYWLGQSVSWPGYYSTPDEFGFGWEDIPGVSPSGSYAYYPYQYWGYYSPSFMFTGANSPPEGNNGQSNPGQPGVGNPPSYAASGYPTNYGLCMSYAYSYYMNSGQGARLTYPIIDISASNISKVTIYMDFLHNGADNYQDRMDFVARASSSASDLIEQEYVRESGTPLFKNGEITGADNGIDIGGKFAAANFENIDVTSPNNAGMIVTGQSVANVDALNVSGGDYGVLVSTSGSGTVDMVNLDLDGQSNAAVYYANDINGGLSGTFTNSGGAAIEYGSSTSSDVEFNNLSLSGNAIGIETAGSGMITLTDSEFGNTEDVVITGSAVVDFIEGTIGLNTVDVTGSGELNRMRIANISVTADSANVAGSSVVVRDSAGNIQGVEVTDSNGKASGITFTTSTVDSTGTTNAALNGYTASTVAEVEYTSSTADFRYATETLTLVDESYNNEETVDLVDQFDARICYNSENSRFITVARCLNGNLGSYQSRTYNSGAFEEFSYFRGHDDSDLSGKVVMMDTPYWYLDTGEHDWNGTDFIFTGSYGGNNANYMYPYYFYGEITVYMNDASVKAAAVSDEGDLNGARLGYTYYAWNFEANNTSFDGIETLSSGVGYGYYSDYMPDFFDVTNSSLTHFKGYTQLNNAIQISDICIVLNGVEGTDINDNTFNNCGVGVFSQRSGYYYTHSSSEIGSDNLSVVGNTFNNGGEIADVWLYTSNEVQGVVISDNVFNTSPGGSAVAAYPGNTKDLDVTGNEVNGGGEDLLFIYNAHNFNVSDNTINAVTQQDETTGIYTYGGSGEVKDNTITDAEYSGIYMEQISTPPSTGTELCSIGRTDYRSSDTCDWNLADGKKAVLDLQTDSWGYEISISVVLNNTTVLNSWSTYTFNSNAGYTPLATYTTPGYYKLYVNDSYGDGGATIDVTEQSTTSQSSSDAVVSGNTIGLSIGRTAPSAVGMTLADCDSIGISSSSNTITLEDNAMLIDDCDVADVGSTLTGVGASGTNGIYSDSAFNGLSLNGTTISGYDTGIYKELGVLSLSGDADISGDAYGIYTDDVEVVSLGASVAADTTDGVALYLLNSDDTWIYPLSVTGDVGVYANNSVFRWDNLGTGTSDATTGLKTEDSTGSIENMTFGSSTTYQIDAGSNSQITSIGHTLNQGELLVHSTSTIDEANLFNIEATHLGAAPTNDVALMISSTDNSRASYVSTSFQPESMNMDGSTDDWFGGNALNPAGYAMPGNMSGDGSNNMYVTYNVADSLYVGLTGVDLSNGDTLIYLSVDGSGSSTGYNGMGGAHDLPFSANYLLWADSTTSYDLYSYGFLGWGPSSLSTESIDVAQGSEVLEFKIPFSRIGGLPDAVDIIAIVQQETTADVDAVHPTQDIDGAQTAQSFTKYASVELKHGDLDNGVLYDEVLVYQSYKGSTNASGATDYNVMVMTDADCAMDWTVVSDVSLANNVYLTSAGVGAVDMLRACPEIQSTLTDITILEDTDADDDGTIDTYSVTLTDLADDEQDEEDTLTWQVIDSNLDAYDNILLDYSLNGQVFSIVPVDDAFGTIEFTFNVTDSNGLLDEKTIVFTIENVNDAPEICNVLETDCSPIFSSDDGFDNILPEGFGVHKKYLGALANQSQSYIRDKANEQVPYRQSYSWNATVPSTCEAFDVAIDGYELVITENEDNEFGGACDVTLVVTDNGTENQDSDPFAVTFSVSPVNDAPVILDWDRQNEVVMKANNGSIPNVPWALTLIEDDTNSDNLTYNLSAIKYDVDHEADDLYWTVESTDQCDYTNYFSATISNDELMFELVPDATTNARIWEIDYLNNNGIHQTPPVGSEFCQIRLVLRDTLTAPTTQGTYNTYIPNYDTSIMPIANYNQGMVTKEIGVRVDNVPELVPDYYFAEDTGFSWNGITSVMTGTFMPVTVTVGGGGDEGPYTYDHMLKVTFHTDGHEETESARYYTVPEYGSTIEITDYVYVTKDTTEVWAEMDVLTCLNNPCDLTATIDTRFQADEPGSHRAVNSGLQGEMWSKPGQYGSNATATSERRPLLEDSNWCNNFMSTDGTADVCNHANRPASEFIATNQTLPIVVGQIGASAVPSFAPSIVAVALVGLFVSALSFTSRRDEDEEEIVQTMKDDEGAVSPVIATILMVAITVVLSGVIYVWASSLAETDVKGVPRVTFDIEDNNGFDAEEGHWRITIGQTETDLATQAVQVRIFYTNASGDFVTFSANLADSNGVYGFNPSNSDAFVTFVDSTLRQEGTSYKSTFSAGDTIFVRTHDPEGTPLVDATITISYVPNIGGAQGSVLKTWSDLSYDRAA